MDLVKPTGYEKLMSQIELERKKFKSVFEATLNAVLDILYAYGYIQYNLFCPGRPMSLQEFLVLNKGGYTFFRCTENVFTRGMKKLVAFSWSWEKQTIDVKIFTSRFQKRLHSLISALNDNSVYLYRLIPPNFEELLQQVLEYRKQNTNAKKEVTE